MKRNKFQYLLAGLISLAMLSGSCDRNRNHPGWDYFPDMFYSKAYETYTPNPNFKDGMTMRTPVEGTVSRESDVFPYTIDEADRARAGADIVNPLAVNPGIISQGKLVYSRYCLMCHGEKGEGDGYLFTSGRYLVKPRPLTGEAGEKLRDGEIYHSITLGFGSMGAHGAQIRPADRWAVITYIRQEFQTPVK